MLLCDDNSRAALYSISYRQKESRARPDPNGHTSISIDSVETACMIRRSIRQRAVNIDEPASRVS